MILVALGERIDHVEYIALSVADAARLSGRLGVALRSAPPSIDPTTKGADATDRVRRCRALADRLRSVEPQRELVGSEDGRPRCSLCGEPIELADPNDPEALIHLDDANDWGEHTAEL